MYRYEVRLAGDNSPVGTVELETLPGIGDKLEVDGRTYVVEEPPRDPSSDYPTILVTRAPNA